MNVTCSSSSSSCPVLLNSKCVVYEGAALAFTEINTNDTLQTILEKLNTAISNAGGGGEWGEITGTLSNQIDLQAALNAKQDIITADNSYWKTSGTTNLEDGFNTQINVGEGNQLTFNLETDGLGGDGSFKIIDIASTQTLLFGFGTGLTYGGDYSTQFTDQTLINRGFANSNYWKTSGTSTISGSSEINVSGFGAAVEFQDNGVTFLTVGDNSGASIGRSTATTLDFNSGAAKISGTTGLLNYSTDKSSLYTDRSVIDRGFANSNYWKTGDFTTLSSTENTIIDLGNQTGRSLTIQVGDALINRALFNLYSEATGNPTISITSTGTSNNQASVVGYEGKIEIQAFNDIAGNVFNFTFDGTNNTAVFNDLRTIPVGIVYGSDITATLIDDSLVPKKYVDDAISGISTITNSAAVNELMMSDGTNAVGSNVYMTGDSQLDLGNTSLSGSDRWITATGSASAVNLNIQAKNNILSALTLIAGETGKVTATSHSFATTSVVLPFKVRTRSTTGVTAGIGTGIAFESATQDSNANFEIGGIIESVATDVTGGSEDFDFVFKTMSAGATAAERVRITSDGRLYGTALHNNSGAVTGTTNQYIASGTYTPTGTGTLNIDSLTTAVCQWLRVGNVVSVSGSIDVDATAASSLTQFRLTLPIASTLVAASSLAGTGSYINVSGAESIAKIQPDGTNDAAAFSLIPPFDSSITYHFHFTYLIT